MASSTTGWTPPDKVPMGTLQAPSGNTKISKPTPPLEHTIKIPDDYLKEPAPVMRRKDWGAKDPKLKEDLITPVKKVVLTWTETDPCFTHEECKSMLRNIQESHMADPDVPDIKHHFMLGRDGAIYEGRGLLTRGPKYPEASAKGYKLEGESLEIAFIDKCTSQPTDILLKTLSECISYAGSGEIIEDTFELYWMSENNVFSIQPTTLQKTPDPDNEKYIHKKLPNDKLHEFS